MPTALPDTAAPASTGNRVDRVYAGILEDIAAGKHPTNGRLPTEAELAEQYQVSRPTVREALSRLRLDGLIASRRGSGSYVLRRPDRNLKRFAPIESLADVQRCFTFRIALESAAAGLAADLRNPRDLEEIQRTFEEMTQARKGDDADTYIDHDLQFHLAIARASQNPFFITALELVGEQMKVGMQLALNLSQERERRRHKPAHIEQSELSTENEHREIMMAIEQGSSTNATDAMRFHLSNARRRLFEGPGPQAPSDQ